MDPKKRAALIVAFHGDDNKDGPAGGDDHEALVSAMDDFCQACEAKDYKAMAEAFVSADKLAEKVRGQAEPDEEGTEVEEG